MLGKLSFKTLAVLAGLAVAGLPSFIPAVHAAGQEPTIRTEASTAVARMGKSLLAERFSFRARTLRVYADTNGELLHIAHSMKVTVDRPDKLLIAVTGDDGSTKFFYDGKTVAIFDVGTNRYGSLAVPNTIQEMLKEVMGRLGVDFPLADFLTNDPNKSFLFGVTSGRDVNTVTIDGVPCRHLVFSQPPGIELELWLEKNERSLPRRLIVTYRNLPGEPSFVAEFSDWDFSIDPSDAEFAFQAPAGATRVELKPPPKEGVKP